MIDLLRSGFWRLTPKAVFFGVAAVTFAMLLAVNSLRVAVVDAQNVAVGGGRDCDTNAVIWCGAGDVQQLIHKFHNGDGRNSAASIQAIFNHFDIGTADIDRMNDASATVRAGSVTRAGNVYVNGDIVATNAMTAGRQPMAGSTSVSAGGTTLYARSPNVSFQSDKLDAFVVMRDGQFAFAVLASCGNPVKATPKPKPAPPAKPVPSLPQQAPKKPAVSQNVCSGNTTNTATNTGNGGVAQGGNCSTNVVNNNPPPGPGPAGQCTSLQLMRSPDTPRTVTATVAYQTQGGAQLQNVTYDFGDSMAIPPTTQTTMMHTYQQDGAYQVKATLTFTAGGGASAPAVCEASIVIATAPTCDILGITTGENRTVTITNLSVTPNEALSKADIDWGDGSTAPGVAGQTHQYAADGTYTVTVTPHLNLGGQDVTASGPNCQQQVSFTTPGQQPPVSNPTVTPAVSGTTPPPSLANVGTSTGSLFGMFGVAVTTAGISTWAFRSMLTRRLT